MLLRLTKHRLMDAAGDDKGGGGGTDDKGDKGGAGDDKADPDPKPDASAKLRAELAAERAERKKLVDAIEEDKKSKLKEANDFKSLYETTKAENEVLKQKHDKLKENILFNEKYKAAHAELSKRGMKPEALKILDREDLKDVVVETTSEGRFLVHGADAYADKFKKEFAFAFDAPKGAKVNAGGGGNNQGGGDTGDITAGKLFEIEKKHGRKSPEYDAALKSYKEMKQKKGS